MQCMVFIMYLIWLSANTITPIVLAASQHRCMINMWKHPRDITSLSSVQFSVSPHSSPSSDSSICSALQTRAPLAITATISHPLSLSIFGYCSVHSNGSKPKTLINVIYVCYCSVHSIQTYSTSINTLLCIYSKIPPDNEQLIYSKHVEDYSWNKLREKSSSCWFLSNK